MSPRPCIQEGSDASSEMHSHPPASLECYLPLCGSLIRCDSLSRRSDGRETCSKSPEIGCENIRENIHIIISDSSSSSSVRNVNWSRWMFCSCVDWTRPHVHCRTVKYMIQLVKSHLYTCRPDCLFVCICMYVCLYVC